MKRRSRTPMAWLDNNVLLLIFVTLAMILTTGLQTWL